MTSLAEFLHDVTLAALTECTTRQREVYQRVHGIAAIGALEPQSLADVARDLGVPKQRVDEALTAARAKVYEKISKSLIIRYHDDEQARTIPAPGIGTGVDRDAFTHMTMYGKRTEQSVDLGPGSRAAESAAKRGDTEQRRSETIRMHQTYARTTSK